MYPYKEKYLPPSWHQAVTWTDAGVLLTTPGGTNISEIWIKLQPFSYKDMNLKMQSEK